MIQIVFGNFFSGDFMGAPKQKWTAEEEAALKAGVLKHGAGKWRTILTDPEFSAILKMRSNVDLKVILVNLSCWIITKEKLPAKDLKAVIIN